MKSLAKDEQLTTKNSVLSMRSLPSVSNMLKAIRNPDCGSENKKKKLNFKVVIFIGD